MLITLALLSLVFLAFISFMLSASEMAVISLNKIRLRHMVQKGVKNASRLQKLLTKSDKLITFILIANNFTNVCFSVIVTSLYIQWIGPHWAVPVSTVSIALFILIFCEITPKIFALKHSEPFALFVTPIADFMINAFSTFILVFTKIGSLLIKIFGGKPSKRSPIITEEELRLLIEVGKEEGLLSDEERKMLHRTFEFGDIKVSEVMVPKDDVVAIEKSCSQEELLNVIIEEGHSRIPVFDGSKDNIIGVLYVRDLLYIFRDGSLFMLDDLTHPAYYVPASMKVSELLRQFQSKKIQIAIVVDENKNTLGLATLEDLIEEIVGDIEEENIDLL